jgi:hypothetical protein
MIFSQKVRSLLSTWTVKGARAYCCISISWPADIIISAIYSYLFIYMRCFSNHPPLIGSPGNFDFG